METLSLKRRSMNRKTRRTALALVICLILFMSDLAAFGQAPTEKADDDHIKVQAAEEPTPRPNYGAMTRAKDNEPPAVGEGVRAVLGIVYTHGETVNGDKDMLMDLYVPNNVEGKIPVLLWVHGGGFSQGTRNRLHIPWISQHGYALATIEYRLAQEAKFPAQIYDCKAAVRWLRANAEKYNLDPDRIAAAGSSAGGHLVSLLGTSGGVKELEGEGGNSEESSRVNAVLNFFGPTDFVARAKERAESGRSGGGRNSLLGVSFEEAPEKYQLASPIAHVSSDDPPFLTTHGDSDPLIPFEQGLSLHKALKAAGVKSKLVEIVGGRHGVPPESYFEGEKARKRILTFLAENLKASAPPAETPRRRGRSGDTTQEKLAKVADIRKDVLFKTIADKELTMDFFVPKGQSKAKYPTLVFVHGGGWRSGTKNAIYADRFAGVVEMLMNKGFMVASIDYRLADGNSLCSVLIADCKDSIRWLRKHAAEYAVDVEKIGIWGPSAGGHLVLMMGLTSDEQFIGDKDLAAHSAKVSFVISWYGTTDFIGQFESMKGRNGGPVPALLGGTPDEVPDAYAEASPINYLKKNSVPILLCHGTEDSTVPFPQSQLLYDKGKEIGADVELLVVKGAGHNFTARGQMEPSLEEIQKRNVEYILKQFGL